MTVPLGPDTVRRDETSKLVRAAGAHVESSRDRVASSIRRLLVTRRPGSPGDPAAGRAEPDAVTLMLDVLDRPCDLDVLLFLHRHPRALMTADDLARRVGHPVEVVRRSLSALCRGGLMASSEPAMTAEPSGVRLYRSVVGAWDDLLPAILWVASSPEGRHALRRALELKRARPLPPGEGRG